MKKTIAACIAATFAVNYSTTAIAEEAFMAPLVDLFSPESLLMILQVLAWGDKG